MYVPYNLFFTELIYLLFLSPKINVFEFYLKPTPMTGVRIEWRQQGCWPEVLGGSGKDFSVWKGGDMRLGVR